MSEYAPGKDRLDAWPLGRVQYLELVASTNTAALEAYEDGLVIVANAQSAGRGRHGNRWASLPGLGLWCSICLLGPPRGLTFAAAAAAHAAVSPLAPVRLKWPNDLLCDGRKLGGILVEHRKGWNALGIGINVHHRLNDFARPLRDTATSLDLAGSTRADRQQVLAAFLHELAPRLTTLRAGGYKEVWREWVALLELSGKRVRREGIEGVVCGLTEDGALRIATEGGEVVLAPGDVDWLEEGQDLAARH